jgi:hypothetical protein
MIQTLVHRIRAAAYKRGHRPAPGSILYSPSLALIYAFADADVSGKLAAALEGRTK